MKEAISNELTTSAKEGIKEEVARQLPNLGPSEYDLAVRISFDAYTGDNTALIKSIIGDIEQRRKRFSNGSSIGTSEFWKKVAADADRSAREELLAGSPQLAEFKRLALEAQTAQDKATAKQNELNRLWQDFQTLPSKAEQIRQKLGTITSERELVADEQKLAETYKANYRIWLETQTQASALDMQYGAKMLTERKLRLEVLDAMRAELDAELEALRRRNVEIAKTLAVKKHDLAK